MLTIRSRSISNTTRPPVLQYKLKWPVSCLSVWHKNVLQFYWKWKKQVRKVLSTRKAPACLLILLYAYGKPRLCINIHHYAPSIGSTAQRAADSAAHRAATSMVAARRCGVSEGSNDNTNNNQSGSLGPAFRFQKSNSAAKSEPKQCYYVIITARSGWRLWLNKYCQQRCKAVPRKWYLIILRCMWRMILTPYGYVATGWRPSVADWGGGMSACCTAGPIVR